MMPSFSGLLILAVQSVAFPSWPSPSTFTGEIAYPSLQQVHNLTWFYDSALPAWRQDIAPSPGHEKLTYLVLQGAYYKIRGSNCTETKTSKNHFALSANQFENFTLVGTNESIPGVSGGSGLDHWVGTFKGYDGAGGWAQVRLKSQCPR
jgi:hypothetical protein